MADRLWVAGRALFRPESSQDLFHKMWPLEEIPLPPVVQSGYAMGGSNSYLRKEVTHMAAKKKVSKKTTKSSAKPAAKKGK